MGAKFLRRVLIIVGLVVIGGAAAQSASAANYGAIYLDRNNGAAGYSYNYPTLYGASARALRACKAYGGRSCRRVTWYKNGCGAVAWSRNGAWGSFGRARTLRVARSRAMQECRRYASVCRVRASACTTRYY